MKNLEFAKARCITVKLFEAAYRDPKEIVHDEKPRVCVSRAGLPIFARGDCHFDAFHRVWL